MGRALRPGAGGGEGGAQHARPCAVLRGPAPQPDSSPGPQVYPGGQCVCVWGGCWGKAPPPPPRQLLLSPKVSPAAACTHEAFLRGLL